MTINLAPWRNEQLRKRKKSCALKLMTNICCMVGIIACINIIITYDLDRTFKKIVSAPIITTEQLKIKSFQKKLNTIYYNQKQKDLLIKSQATLSHLKSVFINAANTLPASAILTSMHFSQKNLVIEGNINNFLVLQDYISSLEKINLWKKVSLVQSNEKNEQGQNFYHFIARISL